MAPERHFFEFLKLEIVLYTVDSKVVPTFDT